MLFIWCLSHSSRGFYRDTPGSAQKWLPLGAQDVTVFPCSHCTVLHSRNFLHELVENDSHVPPEYDTLCCDTSYIRAWISCQFSQWQACIFGTHFPLCQVGSVNGNHFGSRLATRFRRLTWRNGYTWVMTPQVTSESSARRMFLRWYMIPNTKIVQPYKNDLKKHLQHRDRHGRQVENMVRPLGKYLEPGVRHPSGSCLLQDLGANLFSPRSSVLFPERLELPFPSDELLSC